jgi:chromosome partitioning protein
VGGLIVVAGDKGGVGKTTLAYELAAALHATLFDLDWTGGSATYTWGLTWARINLDRCSAALYLKPGRTPRPYRAENRPDLVPGHGVLEQLERDSKACQTIAAELRRLSEGQLIVVDTHPGLNNLTRAAVSVCDLAVAPVPLRSKDLRALAKMLEYGLNESPLIVVPNMVKNPLPVRQVMRLRRILAPFDGLPVASPLGRGAIWENRDAPSAVILQPNPGREVLQVRRELLRIARDVCKAMAA